MNRYKIAILLLSVSTVIFALSPSDNEEINEIINDDSIEISDSSSSEIFDLIFSEARNFYADALVSAFYNDTAKAGYCFDRVFEIIAEISELDNLTPFQKHEYNRFNETVSNEYQTKFAYLIEDTDSFSVASAEEEFFETVLDSVYIGNDTLMVLQDQPGHIAIVRSKKIDSLTKYYSGRASKTIQRFLDLSNKYRAHMLPILDQYGIPEEIFYLPMIESGYNPNANSRARAVGVWQFVAGTGAGYGLKRNMWVDERRDPIKSTHAAAKYLRKLYDEFDDWYLALAAYNSGENRIWRAIKREGTRDYWKLRTLPPETRNYIPSFLAITLIAKNPERYGFTTPETPAWEWDEVTVSRSYGFEDISKACNISTDVLREYNPELRRGMTPSNDNQYILRVPKGKADSLYTKLASLPEPKDVEETELVYHKVRKGQTLNWIARKYGTTVSALVSANHLRNQNQISIGKTLLIPTSSYYSVPEKRAEVKKVITHIVKRGDTLSSIARKYQVSVSNIKSWNDLDSRKPIYPGQRIIINTSKKG
jgi:membrane-bound lytic murein transglycosylase D